MKLTNEQKAYIRRAYAAVWPDDLDMIDYCTGKIAAVAWLPDGSFIPVEKQGIKKNFCFDDSYDYEGAQKMAAHAQTSESYFMSENMEKFEAMLTALKAQRDGFDYKYVQVISECPYLNQTADSKLRDVVMIRFTELIEFTGPVFDKDLPGMSFTNDCGYRYHVPTVAELDALIAAYTDAMKDHEKKCRAYLKRYGMKHVNSWTYWGEA